MALALALAVLGRDLSVERFGNESFQPDDARDDGLEGRLPELPVQEPVPGMR